MNQSILWIARNATKSKWIFAQSWHSSMQNFFIMNRFEHIESKKSIDSTTYNQYRIFVVFVQVSSDENTTLNEIHLEQWTRIGPVLPEIITFYFDYSIIEISASSTDEQKNPDFRNNRQSDVFATIFADVSINSSLLNAKVTKSNRKEVISSLKNFYQ